MKSISDQRKFSDKLFFWYDTTSSKREANQIAQRIRNSGHYSRVTKVSDGDYVVWRR